MRKNLTTITKIVIYLIGIAVVAFSTILLPELAREEAAGKINPPITYPFFVGAWVLSVPIFIALHQTLKLIGYIDHNKAFSNKSVKALGYIKYSSIAFSVLIAISVAAILISAQAANPPEDMPPVPMVGSIFIIVSSLITTFVAVLQRLLQDAINIKSKNDLIV